MPRNDRHDRIIACRPLDPTQLPDHIRDAWANELAARGLTMPAYDDDNVSMCRVCLTPVSVGPRQQELVDDWIDHGHPYTVLCLVCCGERLDVARTERQPIVDLGDPDARR